MPRTKHSQKDREEHEDVTVKQSTKGTVAEKELNGAETDLRKDD